MRVYEAHMVQCSVLVGAAPHMTAVREDECQVQSISVFMTLIWFSVQCLSSHEEGLEFVKVC
jgi:hypothetical protein